MEERSQSYRRPGPGSFRGYRGRGMFFQRKQRSQFEPREEPMGAFPRGSKKRSNFIIQDPSRPIKIFNPKNQTWEQQDWEFQNNDVFIEPLVESKPNTFQALKDWRDLNLPDVFYQNIVGNFRYEYPSKIQAFSLPLITTEPYENLIAQAHNGSGKTIAFALGSLIRVDPSLPELQVIVVAHTRELIQQIFEVYRKLSARTGIRISIMLSQKECPSELGHVLIATPGTLEAQCRRELLDFSSVQVFVVDEADLMFDNERQGSLGPTTRSIKERLGPNCQVICFSATYKDSIRQIVNEIVTDANKIQINKEQLTLEGIKQFFIQCAKEQKLEHLTQIFSVENVSQIIIFVNNKQYALIVVDVLRQKNLKVALIIADMSPQERDSTIDDFKQQKSRVLVTTNLLSRGIDITSVSMICNFDLPMLIPEYNPLNKSVDHETYLHRIGRTGRFGRPGIALNLIADASQLEQLMEIREYFQCEMTEITDIEQLGGVLRRKTAALEEHKLETY